MHDPRLRILSGRSRTPLIAVLPGYGIVDAGSFVMCEEFWLVVESIAGGGEL